MPWRDPYSFRPEAEPLLNPGGWPYGLPYWPLWRALGPVLGWNAFVLLTFVGAGWLAYGWLRELGLERLPALAGGLAFEIAPYRAAQSAGHLLGAISLMLPLALLAFERGRRGSRFWLALAGAALASIPLSGQVHLALGAIPFFALYAVCRTRNRAVLASAAAAVLAAIGAGVALRYGVIAGSLEARGRSLREVAAYSAEWLDFVTRHKRHGSESFVFLGWLTPVAAAAGLVALALRRRPALALALGVGVVVPALLALGTNTRLYRAARFAFPPLRYPRVPERLMPIACLALAALLAFALAEIFRHVRGRQALFAAAIVVVVVAVDLHSTVFGASAADGGNRAYAAVRKTGPGRLLELPAFLPDVHFGSVYLYYDMQARRERPGGYSTLAPVVADEVARSLLPLNCGDWTGGEGRLLQSLGVRAIALHRGLFTRNPTVPDRSWFAWQALLRRGFRPLASDGAVTVFTRHLGPPSPPPMPEPPRDSLLFCQGWYPNDGDGRAMSLGHAPFWVYDSGQVRLFVRADRPLRVGLSVDGRPVAERVVSALEEVRLRVGGKGWHLIAFDTDLPEVNGRPQGARLVAYALS